MTHNIQPLTREDASKVRADKVNAIAKFVADKSGVSINAILNHLVTFGRMYDIDTLIRYYDWAGENNESEADILETIMHDLSGIREDPNTFSPRSSSYQGE